MLLKNTTWEFLKNICFFFVNHDPSFEPASYFARLKPLQVDRSQNFFVYQHEAVFKINILKQWFEVKNTLVLLVSWG